MNELLRAVDKIKKYYYLPQLLTSQLNTIYLHFVKNEPLESFDEVETLVLDLVYDKINTVDFFYEEKDRNPIKINEDIKDGIYCLMVYLSAAKEHRETGKLPFYAANDPELYKVISNLDKLP